MLLGLCLRELHIFDARWHESVNTTERMTTKQDGATDQLDALPQPLVTALEGREVQGDLRSWVARVQGVHGDGRSWWIQVARADDETASVVLRCSRFATVEHVTAVLRRWQPTPAFSLLVMNVMFAA